MTRSELSRIFSRIPTIETPRLCLRRMKVSDGRDMYAYACRDSVTRFLLWDPHPDAAYTKKYLNMLQGLYRTGDFYDWGVEWKQTGKLIGTCGFTSFDLPNEKGEIGYVLSPDFWGMGIAAEAVMAVMEFGFHTLSLHRIEARYIYGNDRSRRVMEKCGMHYEGIARGLMLIKGEHRDIGICAILRREFLDQNGLQDGKWGKIRPRFSFFE